MPQTRSCPLPLPPPRRPCPSFAAVVFYNAINVLYQVLDETLCTSTVRRAAALSHRLPWQQLLQRHPEPWAAAASLRTQKHAAHPAGPVLLGPSLAGCSAAR